MDKKNNNEQNLIIAKLSGAKISSRKVKPVATNIRGMTVREAYAFLDFNTLKASDLLSKLVRSAYNNVLNKNDSFIDESNVVVKDVIIGPGQTLKRVRFGGRGRVKPYRKRSTNVSIFLEVKEKSAKEEVVK